MKYYNITSTELKDFITIYNSDNISKEITKYMATNRYYQIKKYLKEHNPEILIKKNSIKQKHYKILELFNSGKEAYEIADIVGCSVQSIKNILKNKFNINNFNGKSKYINEDKHYRAIKTLELYKEGYTQNKIAKLLGCSRQNINVIIKILKKNNLI